jgi:glyoxylase-like metal-dependent hydrolase (beta-lactamase superfamily II)
VEIIGHVAGRELLEAEAARPWSHRYLREQVAANPRLGPSFRARAKAMPSWDGFAVVPPHRTFTDELTLPTGVRLRHVGGGHAPDSTVVSVPDSAVLLLGDCYYPPPYHLRGPDDEPDLAMLRGLVTGQHEWYVDSHSEPWTRSQAAAQLG